MKRCLHSAAFLLVTAGAVTAQPLPDTLDWHRYVPLAVGNVWEYQVVEGEPLLRREITGDTTAADGRTYFILDESSYEYNNFGTGSTLELFWRLTWYVRYDTAGTFVAVLDPAADTLALPQDNPLDGGPEIGYFDLRAAFADTVFYGPGAEQYYAVMGGYGETVQIGGAQVEAVAVKRFSTLFWYARYAADIGYLGGGNLWGPFLTYARVDGTTYGLSRLPTAVEDEGTVPARLAVEALYPNPVRDRATLVYHLPAPGGLSVAVYDGLGRRVHFERLPVRAAGRYTVALDARAWPPGLYGVRLSTDAGATATHLLIHVR